MLAQEVSLLVCSFLNFSQPDSPLPSLFTPTANSRLLLSFWLSGVMKIKKDQLVLIFMHQPILHKKNRYKKEITDSDSGPLFKLREIKETVRSDEEEIMTKSNFYEKMKDEDIFPT